MKKMLTALLAAAVAGALFVAAPLTASPPGTENFNKTFAHEFPCDNGNQLAIYSPDKLWPPNHKYYEDIYVVATDANDGQVTLVTTGSHDQYVEGDSGIEEQNGAGNTADDIVVDDEQASVVQESNEDSGFPQIVATEADNGSNTDQGSVRTDWDARSERSGRDQTGRSYTLTADATFSDGSSCAGDVTMVVPHDMRPANRGTDHDEEQG